MNNNHVAPLWQILIDRDVGYVRLEVLRRHGQSMLDLLKHFRLTPTPENLFSISKEAATHALEVLFWKDFTHGSEMVSREDAKSRASSFMAQLGDFATEIYSNSDWEGEELSGWNPMTNATFDKGFLFLSETLAVCLWVEEED